MASGPARAPRCLLHRQLLGVVAAPVLHSGSTPVPLARRCAGTVCVGVAGAAGWLVGLALVSPLAAGRQGQCYAVCVYTPVGSSGSPACAPQPAVALEGEALMSSMQSVPPSETRPPAPTQRVGQWRGGARQSRLLLCFCSGETSNHACWPGGCAGTPCSCQSCGHPAFAGSPGRVPAMSGC